MIKIKIIISPAKTMKIDNDIFVHRQMPIFIEESQTLINYLQGLTYEEMKSIWKCSDKLAKENFHRIQNMDLYNNLTPAILSFQGLQYQYMGPGVLTSKQLDYIEKHLRILSGLYGVLKPFDGVKPYRLEMQAKLLDWDHKTLYDFWKEKLAKELFSESNCTINLASKEYSRSITNHLREDTQIINCIFGELVYGRVIQKATLLKMARGEMIRFMAENNIDQARDIKKFNRLGYLYSQELSDDNTYVFIKGI